MSKDMDEQLKLAHKLLKLWTVLLRKICVILLVYIVDKLESSCAQIQFFATKKEDEKFQQIVYVNYTLEEGIYLLDVMNSVYDKVITNTPFCSDQ